MIPSENTKWFLPDASLAVINIFNLFVLLCLLHPVESPLKRIGLVIVNRVVRPVHQVPFLTAVVITLFLLMAGATAAVARKSDWTDTAMIVRSLVALYTALLTSIFVKLGNIMIKLGIDRLVNIERDMEKHDIVTFQPPPKAVLDTLIAPGKSVLRVDTTGLENIPSDKPHLFVMNHSLYGIEMPFLIHTLYKEKDIFVRGLADHAHFATPNGCLLKAMGAVDGTRDNVDVLMQSQQNVLVYPGGGQEVLKHSSVPRYQLMWKERLGFCRMAIKHRYPVIPCAAVGTEEMLNSVMDINIEFVRKGQYIPIAYPNGSIQKIYFWFGEPISTEEYNGDYENNNFARELRDKVKAAVEMGIKQLQARQSTDTDRYLMDRFTKYLTGTFHSSNSEITMTSESDLAESDGSDDCQPYLLKPKCQ